MVIGITGRIGSGKSTAAKIFKAMGAAVIDADRIGREVVDGTPRLLQELKKRFGPQIVSASGKLRRKKLAELAFESEEARQGLNGLVHPYLLKELRRQMKAFARTHEITVIDAALLLEWNLDRELDAVILIHAPEAVRLERMNKRGISRSDALARQRRQLSYTEQGRRATHVIFNNTTEGELKRKLERVLGKIRRKSVDL